MVPLHTGRYGLMGIAGLLEDGNVPRRTQLAVAGVVIRGRC